ncbi:MAG: biotin/lipoate A/B protein ligase family protein [Haloferacaceae archaeon]
MTLDRVDDWRVVAADERRPEPLHHGIDAEVLDRVGRGEAPPTIRFWRRAERGVLLGRFQSYEDEVATDYVEEADVTVVRRITGGGAVYVQPKGVITYSICAPREALPDDVAEGFAVCNEWVAAALRELGVDARHDPLNDIAHPDGKVAGSAQIRRENAVLHHAVLSHTLDVEEMLRALRIGEAKLSDKAVASAESAVAPIGAYTDATVEEVLDHLRTAFTDSYGGAPASLTDAELRGARERVADRFGTAAWTRKL